MEEIGSIPADHSNMTKFGSATDIGFRRVSAQLRRWVEEIRVNEGTQNIPPVSRSSYALSFLTLVSSF